MHTEYFKRRSFAMEFQASNCLFSELVDIGGDDAADQLFDVDVFTVTNVFSEDDPPVNLQSASIACPPPLVTSVPIAETPTKQISRLKHHGQGKGGPKGRGSTSYGKRPPWPTSRNAARERSRVKSLRSAFLRLQNSLPSVPPNTKLSKLDVLVLATTYIAHLMKTLDDSANTQDNDDGTTNALGTNSNIVDTASAMSSYSTHNNVQTSGVAGAPIEEVRHHRLLEKGYLHPVRKWPMRSRLYAGAFDVEKRQSICGTNVTAPNSFTTTTALTAVLNLPPMPTAVPNLMKNDEGGCSSLELTSLPLEQTCTFDDFFAFST